MTNNSDNIADICALAPLQSGFLLRLLNTKYSDTYFTQTMEYLGDIKPNFLKTAWNIVANRHDTLKMGILWDDLDEPVSYVLDRIEVPFEEQDWRKVQNKEEKLNSFIEEDRRDGFNLTEAPLLRIVLIRFEEDRYVMVWSFHHIALDGWSGAIVLGEVFQTYMKLLRGETPQLPTRRAYRDYIGWFKKQNKTQAESFWKKYFGEIESSTQLSFKGAVEIDNVDYREVFCELGEVETSILQKFCIDNQLTINTLMMGALGIILSKYLNQKEIVIGMVTSGRGIDLPGIENMVGLFVNTLPVRLILNNTETIKYLDFLQREIRELDEYGYLSLPALLEWSSYGKDLFNVLFVYENYPQATEFLESNLFIKSESVQKIEYPLSVIAYTSNNKLSWNLYYQTEHFDKKTIEMFSKHLQQLLKKIVAAPRELVDKLEILTEVERKQLLIDWNNTKAKYPKDRCIHELFEEQAAQTPEAVAVVYENRHITYSELNKRSNQLAHYLREKGVRSDTLVAICVDRSLEMIIGILGILKSGGAYVPLDPTYPEDRLAYMIGDTKASILLTQKHLREKVKAFTNDDIQVVYLDDNEEVAKQVFENPKQLISPQNLAYVIYTSGSTGKPKGVQVSHRSCVNHLLVRVQNLEIIEDDIVAQTASYCFDISVWQILVLVFVKCRLVLIKQEEQRSFSLLEHQINKNLVQILEVIPSLLDTQSNIRTISGIKKLILTGEVIRKDAYFAIRDTVNFSVFNAYGPTESTVSCTLSCINDRLSIGHPISNTQIYILDGCCNPVPVGVSGEIYIGGVGLARGYLNRPDLTAEKFMANPFGDGDRLYRTGDLGRYLSDGNIEFLERIDNQVKIRGFRIELGEIEAAIDGVAGIKMSVVLAKNTKDGDKQLVGYVVPAATEHLQVSYTFKTQTAEEINVYGGEDVASIVENIRNNIAHKLPEYMIPSHFIVLKRIPLTPNGKTDNKLLLTLDVGKRINVHQYTAPSSEIEKKLCEIWKEVLYLDEVDINDNFFKIGGHSLLATKIISKIRSELNVDIALKALFEHPVVAELAAEVQRSKLNSRIPPLTVQEKPEFMPLSFAQQRLWIIDKLLPEKSMYNIPYSTKLVGELDYQALEAAINKLISRHESFRTNFFETEDGEGYQVISPAWNFKLSVEDVVAGDISKILKDEAETAFDLQKDRLLRVRLLKLGSNEYLLLITMHHIISDGWSIPIFLNELKRLYNDRDAHLSALPITYVDYAIWQKGWLKNEVLEDQLVYWQKHLQGIPEQINLPYDYQRPAEMSYEGGRVSFDIDSEVYHVILRLAEETNTTVFMVAFAAVNSLLHKYTHQENIVLGTPIANRQYKETEGLIGFFANTLALCTHFEGHETFVDVLAQVRRNVLAGYENQDIPFEYLVDKLNVERRLNVNPLFQVMFTANKIEKTEICFKNLEETALISDYGISKFDLEIDFSEYEGKLYLSIGYSKELFREETIERMAEHLNELLKQVVATPKEQIDKLEILTEVEKKQLLIDWNDTKAEYPKDRCIHELFEEQVAQTPEAVAVVYENQHITYSELNKRSNQVAHYLGEKGVQPDTLVAICVDRSLEMIIGILGILKSGGAYVPLDPTYPEDRLAYMIGDTKASILLTQKHLREKIKAFTSYDTQVVYLDDNEELKKQSSQNPKQQIFPQNLAYVIYTSGSTGKPKGVQISHRGIVNTILAQAKKFRMVHRKMALQIASFSFDASVSEIMTALVSGTAIVLVNPKQEIETSITKTLAGTGTIPVRLLESAFDWKLDTLVVAGETAAKDVLSKYSRVENVINAYGPTEGSICSTMLKIDFAKFNTRNIGRPISNTQIYILDECYNPVPIGISGEIYIGGVSLARGYLNRPDLTAEKFIANPFGNGDRLYKTGDLGRYLSDGNIEFLGRIDNQVKVRGFRIELGEIESAIDGVADIKMSVVLAKNIEGRNKQLVGYVVPVATEHLQASYTFKAQSEEEISVYEGEGAASIVENIRNNIANKLPEYMIPSYFIVLNKIPLTPNGKTDNKLLLTLDVGKRISVHQYTAPRNETEEKLCKIWREVLHLDQVGINDNFFKIGGDSILAIHLVSQAKKSGLAFAVKDIFNCQTISKLAQIVVHKKNDEVEYVPQAFELLSANIMPDVLQNILKEK